VAARAHGGGGETAAARREGGGGSKMDAGETEEREAAARARLIYDRWDPRFSFTPVDPTRRV
jgi:hypothetical protein